MLIQRIILERIVKVNRDAYIHGNSNGRAYYYLFSILSYDDVPLVFAAKDDKGDLYLCDCVEMRNIQRWIVAKTNYIVLNDIVNKKKSVYEALGFDQNIVNIIEYNYDDGVFRHKERCNLLELPSAYVPDQDSYISFPDEDAARRIRVFSYLDSSAGPSQEMRATYEEGADPSLPRYRANEQMQEGSQYAKYEDNAMSIIAA